MEEEEINGEITE